MGRHKKNIDGIYSDIEKLSDWQKVEKEIKKFIKTIAIKERLTVDQWSDKYRYLSNTTSSEPGKWRTSRFPFLKKFMWYMSPQSKARRIVAMKGHQLGFSEALINKIFYNADHYPGPTLYVQKTDDAAIDFATQKLDPSIEVTIKVQRFLSRKRSEQYTREILSRTYDGGFISMGGANSGPFLRSKSIRDAMLDEEDSFKLNIDQEGSPASLIEMRQSNFPLSKLIRTSTPKIKETSTIEPAFLAGSQERYYLPCPNCNPNNERYGFFFCIKWDYLKNNWIVNEAGEVVDAWLVCPNCGERIDEYKKTWMLENGRWMTNHGDEKNPLEEIEDCENPSMFINSFYSPLGFYSWKDAARKWLEYKTTNDPAILQVFINQICGETFSLAGQDVSSIWLQDRKEDYFDFDSGEVVDVPKGGLVLTLGADVHPDRIEAEVVAWGIGLESWSVDYCVLLGNTDYLGDMKGQDPNTGQPTVWTEFDRYLLKRWRHSSGAMMPVEMSFIDCRYRSEQVHAFCKPREGRRIYPVIGRDTFGHVGYIKRPKKRQERWGTWMFTIWVDDVKDTIYQNFVVDTPGPGFVHFPNKNNYDGKYFKGLTAENKKVKYVGGHKKLYWDLPSGARNEPLDARVYSFAALIAFGINLENRANKNNPIEMERNIVAKPARTVSINRKLAAKRIEV